MARSSRTDAYEVMAEEDKIALKAVGEERIRERVKEYESDFEIDSLTTVDRTQIRRMAKLELIADRDTDELDINPNLTPGQRKALMDSAKAASAEARQLADTLGMSRSKRLSDEEAEQEALIPKIYREAKDFIYQHAVAIVCPHCREEEAHVEIRAGTIIYHFAFEGQWSFKCKCMRESCGKWFEINQDNYLEYRFDTLNQYEDKPREIGIEETGEEDDNQEES